jgi:hypothetical protein
VNARTLSSGEVSIVEPLVRDYPFKPYRNYRVVPRKAQTAVLLAEITQTLTHADGVVTWLEHEGGAAVTVARALEWDSRFFGVPMGRIDYVVAPDRTLVASAVAQAVEALRARGVRHISARVDVADVETMAVFEAAGFHVMDALVTYITRPRKDPPNVVREVGAIRPFRPEDGPALIEIATEAYRGFRGRFHLDPHIPDERADQLYREWAKQCVGARMADMVMVSEGADGRLLGFLAFRRREPVSSAGGVPVFGGGLGACRVDAPGAYAGLIRAGTLWAHERDGVAECQTQNYNFPVIRIYEAVGAHYVRAEYTLHRWLD